MMTHLNNIIASGELIGKTFDIQGKSFKVKLTDDFSYVDPIDKSVTRNQVSVIYLFCNCYTILCDLGCLRLQKLHFH